MKQYSIRETKAKFSELLKELPFEVKNHNRVVAIVMAPSETPTPKPDAPKPKAAPVNKILDGISTNTVKEIKAKVQKTNSEAPKSQLCPECGSLFDIYGQCQNRFRHKKKK